MMIQERLPKCIKPALSICLLVLLVAAGCGRQSPPQETPLVPAKQKTLTMPAPLHTPLPTLTQTSTLTSTPEATPTFTLTPSPSPTPAYSLDLSPYDPDLFPPIDMSHNPPLIARSDEMLRLVFDFTSVFCMQFPLSCLPEGVLYYAYGQAEEFQHMVLSAAIVEEMESLVATLPAADQDGNSLRYYADFAVPEAGYTQRYPAAGTIDVFTTSSLIPVELPTQNPAQPGDQVFDFFWGFAPGEVRQAMYEGYPRLVGPPALDVSNDGRIALLDPVNARILTYSTVEKSYTSFVLPFTYKFWGDLAFDEQGRLTVFDLQGNEVEGAFAPVPHAYRLNLEGEVEASAPVYVRSPAKITRDGRVLDYYDSRLVVPFDPAGEANSRQAQRQKESWQFPYRYVEGMDPYVTRYADVQAGAAFELHSQSPLGVLTEFARTPAGYVMTFSIGDIYRAVWIDAAGSVLKDISLPVSQHTEINFNAQVAVTVDGAIYVLSSTERGIEVHFATAP